MYRLFLVVSLALSVLSGCCGGADGVSAQVQASAVDSGKVVIDKIMSRRSIRNYKPQPVGRDTLAIIAKCGINAPSGMNRQPWEVRIVDNKEFIDGLTEIYRQKDERAAADTNMRTMFRNAYSVIFVAGVGGAQLDCGILGENMVLSAWSMGVGTCFLGGPIRFLKTTPECQPYLERLGFSEGAELIYALAVGYPDESPEARPRDESKVKFVD